MGDWHTYTPDGRELFVSNGDGEWTVRCGSATAQNRILDVALIEAIRADADLALTVRGGEYAAWVREQAARIEQESAAD